MFGPSDDSNDDRADQKHRDHNQSSPGRSKRQIGQANHCCTHAHRRQPAATSVVESLGDLVAWQWRSGVQLEWISRQDMEKAAETIVHLAMIWEERA